MEICRDDWFSFRFLLLLRSFLLEAAVCEAAFIPLNWEPDAPKRNNFIIMSQASKDFFKSNVLGHPAGLFILFFTEMWERFSYYGMRILLVIFLTAAVLDGGWGWERETALALFGTYASLVYLTPIVGGYLADHFIGYRRAVVIGATIMTLGHASMALEDVFNAHFFLYLGLALLVIGNGFFKPNMTSIISEMYKDHPEKKDGAYTIFYMGVNAGAFLGILLCGYLGEKLGWGWGFGLAGIFMFFGMLQFYFASDMFGEISKSAKEKKRDALDAGLSHREDTSGFVDADDKPNPFTLVDKIWAGLVTVAGLTWLLSDPYSKITGSELFNFSVGKMNGSDFVFVLILLALMGLLLSRISRYSSKVVRDRMYAVIIFAFFVIFFWMAFEQAGGSMNIFARDYTNRVLTGNSIWIFNLVNTLLTVVPLVILTYVLVRLFQETFSHYALSNVILATSFVIIWGIVIWMLKREYSQETTEVAATWFGILNSFFIIALAPLFSKWWESKYNPSAAFKYGFGLILLGIGFAALAYGASTIPSGAKVASVSMLWLILAYLFHTLGELCLSPVGLSYVSKLVPGRMIAFMFGMWYIAIAIANKLAGLTGGLIDTISEQYSLSTFFLIFTLIPIGAGVIIMLLNPLLKRLMHGVH